MLEVRKNLCSKNSNLISKISKIVKNIQISSILRKKQKFNNQTRLNIRKCEKCIRNLFSKLNFYYQNS